MVPTRRSTEQGEHIVGANSFAQGLFEFVEPTKSLWDSSDLNLGTWNLELGTWNLDFKHSLF